MMVAVLVSSSNFQLSELDRTDRTSLGTQQATPPQRATPLGSDFLQEWTGGHILLSEQRSELYNADHFREVQHDQSLLGFSWPESKYYPMVYPPFYYLLVSPLSLLPFKISMLVWQLAMSLFAGLSVFLWCKYFPPAERNWGKCLFATVAFYPLLMCFNTAHKSAFMLCIFTATYLLLFHRRKFAAGLVFGLIAFKPHLAILIPVAMLLKREWRFVAGCCSMVAGLVLLSFAAGTDLCADYLQLCLSMGDYSANGGYQLEMSHSLLSALQLTIDKEAYSLFYSSVVGVCLVAIIGLLALSLRGKIDTSSPQFALQFSALVIATVLISPHFYTYDLTILLLPLGLVIFFGQANWTQDQPVSRVLIGLAVALFVVVGVSAKVAAVIHFQPTIGIMLGMLFAIQVALRSESRSLDFGFTQRSLSQNSQKESDEERVRAGKLA